MRNPIFSLEKKYLMPTYTRSKIVLERGKGVYVFDTEGHRYLDFVGGIATCPLGHSHSVVVRALQRQARKLLNASNLFYTQPQTELAKKLSQLSGIDAKVFFCNSGAEAVEAAIKLARKSTGKRGIIATQNAFHGRTFGALSATGKEKFRKPFMPLVPGFKHIAYNDVRALAKAIDKNTAAFIVEPIQGEAGVVMPSPTYLREVSALCKKKGVLLIVDEIQTGMGRTGAFFAYSQDKIKPDIVTLAKGLANGVPIGAVLAKPSVAKALVPGDHGSTFGGNSLATATAISVLDVLLREKLLSHVRQTGNYFLHRLRLLARKHSFIKEVRGRGLIIAVELSLQAQDVVNACIQKGLLINCCAEKVLRFLPPLLVTEKQVDEALNILDNVLANVHHGKN